MPFLISSVGAPRAQAVTMPVTLPAAANRTTRAPAQASPASMMSPTYHSSTRKTCDTLVKKACQRSSQEMPVSPVVGEETGLGAPFQMRLKDGAPSTMTPDTRQKGAVSAVSPYGLRSVVSVAVSRVHMIAPTTARTYVAGWCPREMTSAMPVRHPL